MTKPRNFFGAAAKKPPSGGQTKSEQRLLPVGIATALSSEPALEHKRTLTIAEVAELTGLSRQTINMMFRDEPGVIVINRPETLHKRGYRSIRIPRAVYERVVRKITN